MNRSRTLIYFRSIDNSSLSLPKLPASYEKRIRKLFLASCRKHGLKSVHVDLFFYLDFNSRKAASVDLGDFEIYNLSFNMVLNDDLETFIKSWEHEFCHIAQLHKGRLKYKRTSAVWNNRKTYTYKQRKYNYMRLPWEIEARRAEKNYYESLKLVNSKRIIHKFCDLALKNFLQTNNIHSYKSFLHTVIPTEERV